jgi:HrpA-like RNA helicase
LLAASKDHGCADEVLTIAAMLSVEEIYVSPRADKKKEKAALARRGFADRNGDHMTLLRIYRTWESNEFSKDWCFDNFIHYRALRTARNVRGQLETLMRRLGLKVQSCRVRDKKRPEEPEESDPRPVLKSISAAYYTNLARQQRDRPFFVPYSTTSKPETMLALYLHQNSALFSESSSISQLDWVVYTDVTYTSKATMRNVSRVDWKWVEPLLSRLKEIDDEKLSGVKNEPQISAKRRNSLLELMEERGGAVTPALEDARGSKEIKADEFVEVHERVTEGTRTEVDTDVAISGRVAMLKETEAGSDSGTDGEKRKEREDSVNAARERYLARKKTKR